MDKTKKHIILQLREEGIYYNLTDFVRWPQTNFPDKQTFGIRKSKPFFWLVEMQEYDKSTGALQVQVIDYDCQQLDNYNNQKPKSAIVRIHFIKLIWEELEGLFSFYQKQKFESILSGSTSTIISTTDISDIIEPEIGTLQFNLKQPISNLTFKMGYVETHAKLEGVSKKALIKLENPYIIPEFEYIKFYFSQVFGKKQISIIGSIANKNDASTYKFYSPEINSINENIINGIKRLELDRKIKKPTIVGIDKSLFTPDEYFDGFEGEKGNQIRKSDQELLEEILELNGVRNRKQLAYIAGKLQSKKERLHFTLTPKFGFLFFVEGEEMQHYIWELLDSNATYLWSCDVEKPRVEFLKIVSQKINYIKDQGRMSYLRHEENKEVVFSKVNHESTNSKVVDGFPKWRKRLEERLV